MTVRIRPREWGVRAGQKVFHIVYEDGFSQFRPTLCGTTVSLGIGYEPTCLKCIAAATEWLATADAIVTSATELRLILGQGD